MEQLQGIVGMQAFIMMQWLISQRPEAEDCAKQDHAPKRDPAQQLFASRRRESTVLRWFNPFFFFLDCKHGIRQFNPVLYNHWSFLRWGGSITHGDTQGQKPVILR